MPEFTYAFRLNEITLLNRPGDSGRGRLEMLVEDTSAEGAPDPGSAPRWPICKLVLHDCSNQTQIVNGNALRHGVPERLSELADFIAAIPDQLVGQPDEPTSQAAYALADLDQPRAVLTRDLGGALLKAWFDIGDRPGWGRAYIGAGGREVRLDFADRENAEFKCQALADALRRFTVALCLERDLACDRLRSSAAAWVALPPQQRKHTQDRDDDIPF